MSTLKRLAEISQVLQDVCPILPHEIVEEDGYQIRFGLIADPGEAQTCVEYYTLAQPALIADLLAALNEAQRALGEASEVPLAAYPGRARAKRALAEIQELMLR